MSATDLHDLCDELLAASVEALDTIPTSAPELAGSPERSFISPGLPALDCCPQLTVHSSFVQDAPTSPGGLGAGRKVAGKVNHVGLVVTIVRCIPVIDDSGTLPALDDMQEAAEQINADGWALWNHLYNLWLAGQLLEFCSEVFWEGLRPVTPQGGCAGWTLSLRVSLGGYQSVV